MPASARAGISRKQVKAQVTVAASDSARAALADGVTLDQALVLTEFEDDPQAVADLTETARRSPYSFEHAAQRLRDDRERASQRQAPVEDLTSQGVTVVDEPDPTDPHATTAYVADLQDGDGAALTVEEYRGKPG